MMALKFSSISINIHPNHAAASPPPFHIPKYSKHHLFKLYSSSSSSEGTEGGVTEEDFPTYSGIPLTTLFILSLSQINSHILTLGILLQEKVINSSNQGPFDRMLNSECFMLNGSTAKYVCFYLALNVEQASFYNFIRYYQDIYRQLMNKKNRGTIRIKFQLQMCAYMFKYMLVAPNASIVRFGKKSDYKFETFDTESETIIFRLYQCMCAYMFKCEFCVG